MAPKNFHHPFEPYEIQQQFMDAVYNCIEDGKVGIFESPTGTGKSLSLICGSLTWLREHRRQKFDEAIASIEIDDGEPEWIIEHAKETRRREARELRDQLEARLQAVRERERKVRERQANAQPPHKKRKVLDNKVASEDTNDDHFVLDDYQSDDEKRPRREKETIYSTETLKLMESLGILPKTAQDPKPEENEEELKIFVCSRTHSQLSQFAGELKKVVLPPALPPNPTGDGEINSLEPSERLKHLPLGSRKNLCINPKVADLPTQTAVNERCIELQQTNTPSDEKCSFVPGKNTEDLVLDFRDHALAKIRDIEELGRIGSKLQICPYYASRSAIAPAEMVTLPYPLLLQKSAREALGISLKGHVVIVDEAHNLINAIEGIYSTSLSKVQLTRARESLLVYLQKFRSRLKGKNRVYVTQVVRIMDSLLACISGVENERDNGGIINVATILSGKAVDQINLSKLVRYINDSKLARKIEGYITHSKKSNATGDKGSGHTNTPEVPNLSHLQNFLTTLMNPSEEGRFFWSKENQTTVLRYLLLDPSEHFRDVVEDARAVVLAGGTMSPMEDYRVQLFPYLPSITTLSCGHLVPKNSLLVRSIAADDAGTLEFSFKNRANSGTASRIGHALLHLLPCVRGGLVVFFPSYGYLDQTMNTWREGSILEKFEVIKPHFCDSRHTSAEDTFKSFSQAVAANEVGAVLFSVIGGKLSEGINFSDDLGRCVVVVGLPFPNLETPEWKAKTQYMDDKAVARGEAKGKASREHAENICMRSVNQAIGRVIRHKDDWASILLLDSRYSQDRIRSKLPGWIKECLPSTASSQLKAVIGDVRNFFRPRMS